MARVKALFQVAVERPADEHDAFLAAATGDDAAFPDSKELWVFPYDHTVGMRIRSVVGL